MQNGVKTWNRGYSGDTWDTCGYTLLSKDNTREWYQSRQHACHHMHTLSSFKVCARICLQLLDEKKKKKDQIELHIHHVVKPFNLRTRVSVFTHPPVVSYTCTICYSGLDSCFLRSFFPIMEVAGFCFFQLTHYESLKQYTGTGEKKFW